MAREVAMKRHAAHRSADQIRAGEKTNVEVGIKYKRPLEELSGPVKAIKDCRVRSTVFKHGPECNRGDRELVGDLDAH
ncbi:hypothetical protein BH09PLA1_BH09PLA1_08310 [soil metagenome]